MTAFTPGNKRYVEYLEAAFLIKRVHRIDQTGKRFKRANYFKVYLTNPSLYAALFSRIYNGDKVMGLLAETAVFAQWFHSRESMYYARWRGGEVDIVCMGPMFNVDWVVEVKWTDRFFDRPGELKNVVEFCRKTGKDEAIVTSRTKKGFKKFKNIDIEFIPASLYCYISGQFILQGKKAVRKDISYITT